MDAHHVGLRIEYTIDTAAEQRRIIDEYRNYDPLQAFADTLALIRIGRDGTTEVKRFNMTSADLANALRVIANELDTYATRDK